MAKKIKMKGYKKVKIFAKHVSIIRKDFYPEYIKTLKIQEEDKKNQIRNRKIFGQTFNQRK